MQASQIKQITALLLIATLSMIAYNLCAQNDEGFIYGTITTIEDQEYTGQIRWGKEEAFWTDHFNVGKYDNDNLEYLTRDEIRELGRDRDNWFDWDWGRWTRYGDRMEHLHSLVCQFGEVSGIEVYGREKAIVTLRNGMKVKVKGQGYNDIGSKIRVLDDELGLITIRWSQIDNIAFSATPKKLNSKMGEALFGDVYTSEGKFTGFVQWDHDERLSIDELDGDTMDGDVSIKFGKIRKIENRGNSSDVELKSGRKLNLRGTNDVDRDNDGIIVTLTNGSRIDIPWEEFDKVEFKDNRSSGRSYDSFKNQNELQGTVVTGSGEKISGKIIFDLDEQFDFEVIQGKYHDLEYLLPLREVVKITPKNYDNSYVELRNGQKLLLGDAQDVSDRNDGILVFKGNRDPQYIPWDEVEEVMFN